MSNESLYKLFYSNYQEYNEEYEKRFNSNDTIKFDILIGNNPAFFCPSINI